MTSNKKTPVIKKFIIRPFIRLHFLNLSIKKYGHNKHIWILRYVCGEPLVHRVSTSGVHLGSSGAVGSNLRGAASITYITKSNCLEPYPDIRYWRYMPYASHDVGPVPARYVRQSQMCPQLDVSDKNDKKTQDMSDKARRVRQKLLKI